MKKIVSFLFYLLLAAILCSCSNKNGAIISSVNVQTPYADLVVPQDFLGNVKVKIDSKNNTVDFTTAAGNEVFSISFDDEEGFLLGTLNLEDKSIPVYAIVPEISEDNPEYDVICEYQEGINTILDNLISNYNFTAGQYVEIENDKTFDITTSVVTLKYPEKWKSKVDIKVTDECVKFSTKGISVFDIVFNETSKGYLLGTYNNIPISVINYDTNNNEQAEMQEDIDVIFQNLMKDDNFTINMN